MEEKEIQVIENKELVSAPEDASVAGYMMRVIQESAREKTLLAQVPFMPLQEGDDVDGIISMAKTELNRALGDESLSGQKRLKLIRDCGQLIMELQKHKRLMTGRTYGARQDVTGSLKHTVSDDGTSKQSYELNAFSMEEDF